MEKILIVDDKEENLYLLETLLKSRGFAALPAENGLEALKIARDQIPYLIISDILMPVMDGFTLCREWKADPDLKDVPFVFYTATYTDPKDEKFALSLGADRFILKPKAPDDFMEIIQDVIQNMDQQLIPPAVPVEKETVQLKEYNEALVRKLEDKMVQLEKANEELKNEILNRTETEKRLKQSLQEMSSLNKLSRRISTTIQLDEVVSASLDEALSITGSDVVMIYFREGDELHLRGLKPEAALKNEDMTSKRIGECLCGLAAEAGKPVYSKDIHNDNRCTLRECKEAGVKSFAALPLSWNNHTNGVMGLASMSRTDFGKNAAFIETIAHQVSSSFENSVLHKNLRDFADELREKEEQLSLALETANLGMYDFNPSTFSEAHYNDQWFTMLGYDPSDLTHTPETWLKLLHPDDSVRAQKKVKEHLENNVPYTNEFRLKTKKGDYRWIYSIGKNIKVDAEGLPVRMIGIHLDITDRKKMETQLHQSQKIEAIGTLAGGIAHDFNNILSAIIGYTELSIRDLENDSPLQKNLTEVLVSADRATNLVKQILTFSRQAEIEHKPIHINPLVKEAVKLLRSTLPSTINIDHQAVKENLTLNGDPTQIHQILINLATNAAHAMEETGGDLKITVDPIKFDASIGAQYPDLPEGEYAQISVSDTGTGIPKENLAAIFDPYFTTKEKERGTGLGLSVVHGIVKTHKGHITVYSEPGRGTVFHVYLPLIKHSNLTLSKDSGAKIKGGSERVLIVDDEESIVGILEDQLRQLGYSVTSSTSSLEALQVFRQAPAQYDIVITDMTMPEMTGDQLSRELIKIRQDVPIILCSGYSSLMDKDRARELGIKAYVMKPVVKSVLAQKIREVLDEKRDEQVPGCILLMNDEPQRKQKTHHVHDHHYPLQN